MPGSTVTLLLGYEENTIRNTCFVQEQMRPNNKELSLYPNCQCISELFFVVTVGIEPEILWTNVGCY
jgi:hypothetical protein